MRKICVVTGTRAEYGILKPLLRGIVDSPTLQLQLVATGMHLLPEFGHTVDNIRQDGFHVDKTVPMHQAGDSRLAMVQSVGKGILGLSEALRALNPDYLVILGDRTEIFAAAVAGAFLGKIVCHIHGGDTSFGGLDEYMRHAVTKLSHIHFTATPQSYGRVVKLGERPDLVFCVGAPGLDAILYQDLYSREAVYQFLGWAPGEKYLLLVQHSVSTQPDQAGAQIRETLAAVKQIGVKTACIYPNSDAGGELIIEHLEKLREDPQFRLFKNVPRKCYLSLLKYSFVLLGNSSSGMIEAASFHVPVVNVGIRQVGRERAENVIDVPHDCEAIEHALERALGDDEFLAKVRTCTNPYGDGTASEKIVKILEEFEPPEDILRKRITY